jgi:hypothetical protein
MEEAIYDSAAMRGFAGIDLGREPVPDETTVCRFRHLLVARRVVFAYRSNPAVASVSCFISPNLVHPTPLRTIS